MRPSSQSFTKTPAVMCIADTRTVPSVTPLVFTSAEFRAHIEAETEKWGKVIRAANIKAE
jgi:tripartite-type tricarboxylate transporter receptor subunit TctC